MFFIPFITLLVLCVVHDSICCTQFAKLTGIRSGFKQQDTAVEDLRLDVASLLRHSNVKKGDVRALQPGYVVSWITDSIDGARNFASWSWPRHPIYAFLFRLTPF
ncbi:hypothetical protein GCM10007415_40730 [Parapedobacter pyrenivorans]|uniref:Uncharacterized protein n=1 Tax=Parapedobacter pyrenivorans TaxID=1305674 RepID=A0A917I0D4_9SPHI|nr:hypothetical protein [Parapedobacter pyrenivorans]GGH00631.1 hypothetical protein GCM10007415_40730 [Parapedobacter pyrenivorans]